LGFGVDFLVSPLAFRFAGIRATAGAGAKVGHESSFEGVSTLSIVGVFDLRAGFRGLDACKGVCWTDVSSARILENDIGFAARLGGYRQHH